MRRIAFSLFLLVFFGCMNKHHNFYNESDYVLVKTDSFNGKVDRELYVYKYDSARKMLINYWDNGKVMGKGFSYKGQLDGSLNVYDMDGKLSATDSFSKGKKISSKEFFTPDTSVKIFRNGKMEPFTSIDSLKQ
ncbi:hypothetical protein [Ferruginibacter sp. SUN106]|uniref:hypothetical protein n=1 Tax=Ferruginibacter sp. SUN106 TaxID=2978348 RepID=UPI003D36DF12